jgi:primosomal protein N' (replication factor Y)
MLSAEIIINQKAQAFNQSFSYIVPAVLVSRVKCGVRVLVPLGNRKVEGYVRSLQEITNNDNNLKAVIDVLDKEPVVSPHLFELADWMAEYYLAPISSVLSLMVPPAPARTQANWIITNPQIDSQAISRLDSETAEILSQIAYSGGIDRSKAVKLLGEECFAQLSRDDIIIPVSRYGTKRYPKVGWAYRMVRTSEFDLDKIRKRAPRQAQILELLMKAGEIDCQELEKTFASSSIRSLEQQGFIEKSKIQPQLQTAQFTLSPEQGQVVSSVQAALAQGKYKEFLLQGVTGSGKTEVYINCVRDAVAKGLQSIVLVPEIALTEHLVQQFAARIPNTAILHSGLTYLERHQEWKRIADGKVNVVLGTRSAVFAPLDNLGLIIIDEEHESTYKQEESPRYHAREVARFRCQLKSAVLLLGSATPSIESFYRTISGKSQLLSLPERVEGIPMPRVAVEDMKTHLRQGNVLSISPPLAERIQDTLDSGQQCILFLNRRGYSPMTICRECGIIATCPRCAVSLNYHEDIKSYLCHYCNYQIEEIKTCAVCSGHYLARIGLGTQKVEEDVRKLFPQARVDRLDLDSTRRRGQVQRVLTAMHKGKTDILVGTQMVAKGLDFPRVSLVGIINADGMLSLPDYRAGERTFQLLVQAAGRSGRSNIPGEVIIQTFQPDHAVINMAIRQDYLGFFTEEIRLRKSLDYPPFSRLLRIEISSPKESQARHTADVLRQLIEERIDSIEDDIHILGPAPCPVWKLRNRYRFQIVLKTSHRGLLQSLGNYLLQYRWDPGVRVVLDMDPGIMM